MSRDEARVAKWKAAGDAIATHVTAEEGAEGEAVVYCAELDSSGRLKRGLKALAVCWGLAVASLPIVVFHFVLVPGFLLAGPVLFVLRFKEERVVLGAMVTCPGCGHVNRLKSRAEEWPIAMQCDKCREDLALERAPAHGPSRSSDGRVVDVQGDRLELLA